jgi:hypothetical protein
LTGRMNHLRSVCIFLEQHRLCHGQALSRMRTTPYHLLTPHSPTRVMHTSRCNLSFNSTGMTICSMPETFPDVGPSLLSLHTYSVQKNYYDLVLRAIPSTCLP